METLNNVLNKIFLWNGFQPYQELPSSSLRHFDSKLVWSKNSYNIFRRGWNSKILKSGQYKLTNAQITL